MNKEFYTSQEAADELGISQSRVRQLALANLIEHQYFGRSLMISAAGIEQARLRKRTRGPEKSTTRRRTAA